MAENLDGLNLCLFGVALAGLVDVECDHADWTNTSDAHCQGVWG